MKAPTGTQTPPLASDASDHLVGDGLRVKKNVNKNNLWVDGDGCRVTLSTNSGHLRVTGDGCRVQITRNLGSVEYTGDGGRIVLGMESSRDNVKYRGDGGVIEFAKLREESGREESPKATVKTEDKSGSVTVNDVTITNRDIGRSSDRQEKSDGKKEEEKKSARKVTGTKTKVHVKVRVKSKVSM